MDVLVPGSVANLGGGFDTLAVAVRLYLRVRIIEVRDDGGTRLTVVSSRPAVSGENAVERAFSAIAKATGRRTPSVFAEVESDIPMAAGLGSSAAATVAGLRVFERVTAPLPESTLLGAASSAEGHADNAAAAIRGGLTSVVTSDEAEPRVLGWRWPADLQLVVATPSVGLATAKARAALPATLPRQDAVFNLQRVVSFLHALEHGEYDQLREAVRDRWHQPARMALVPQLDHVLAVDDPDVLGAFLSGAGPSVAVLVRRDVDRVTRLLHSTYERNGCPATLRTLDVHQSSAVSSDASAFAHGRTV